MVKSLGRIEFIHGVIDINRAAGTDTPVRGCQPRPPFISLCSPTDRRDSNASSCTRISPTMPHRFGRKAMIANSHRLASRHTAQCFRGKGNFAGVRQFRNEASTTSRLSLAPLGRGQGGGFENPEVLLPAFLGSDKAVRKLRNGNFGAIALVADRTARKSGGH